MVEQRGGVQDHLEEQHRDGGRAERRDHRQLDAHRDQDLDRMEPQADCGVKIKIGVVHPVQPPEPRHRMEHHMLKVDRQIE